MIYRMNVKEMSEILRRAYGSHAAVARELGVGDRYYRGVRNGTFPVTERMAAQLRMLVRLAQRPDC